MSPFARPGLSVRRNVYVDAGTMSIDGRSRFTTVVIRALRPIAMLVTRSLALGGGLLVGVLAMVAGVLGGSAVATPCGFVAALVVGPLSEGFTDDLATGTAAGALGGLMFTIGTFVIGTVRFALLAGDLPLAIDVGLRTALPVALSFVALFAVEGLFASVVVGWSVRRLSRPA